MRKIFFLLSIISVVAAAQTASVKVSYLQVAPSINDRAKSSQSDMMLLSGTDGSKYYNTVSQYCDSMTATPEGKKKLSQIQMAAWMTTAADGSMTIDMTRGNAPQKKVHTYVVKDFRKGTMTVYGRWSNESGRYTEPTGEQEWEIIADSTRTVMGYECVKARTNYHGREWTAWFSPEIAVQDGPWKLCGLPGLILLAESAPGFRFEATGIEKTAEEIGPVYKADTYPTVDRKKALADHEYYLNNRESILKAQYGVKINNTTDTPKFDPQSQAYEPDYR